MQSRTFEKELVSLIAGRLALDESSITREARFIHDLHMSVLDQLDLLTFIEDEFEIDIPTEASRKFRTVADLEGYLESVRL